MRGGSNKFSSRTIALVCQDVFTLTLGSLQLPLAWLPNNSPRYGKRTTATGLQLTIGNSSGIMAPFVRPPVQTPGAAHSKYVFLTSTSLALPQF